ncbi:MAG TPA: methyltransferase domain-containing protein, partial [Thermoanaerobaculia bacterium]|nr:methyltransferase domain-containing protein [Thermoanaerobaculia bacterium]
IPTHHPAQGGGTAGEAPPSFEVPGDSQKGPQKVPAEWSAREVPAGAQAGPQMQVPQMQVPADSRAPSEVPAEWSGARGVPADSSQVQVPTDSPGSILRVLQQALLLAGDLPPGPLLDLGCATGRTSFALAAATAATGCQVLGVDLSWPMLRLASEALRHQRVRYPRRRVGLVYDRREFPVRLDGAERVDFWTADATALPFPDSTFSAIVALNVLDCVPSPYDLLAALPRLLVPGGKALFTCPYDWSAGATPVEAWLGGHSQRGPAHGASEPPLRALLSPGAHPASLPGVRILAEEESLPWRVRLHERSTIEYRLHLVVVEKLRDA